MSKHKHPEGKKKGGFPLLQLALGAALAAGAGYYVTHREEVDKEAKKRIDQMAKLFRETRKQVEKRVKKVWGETSKEAIATYMDLRGQLLHELEEENLKKRGKMLKEQYDKIVDEVTRRAKKSGILTPEIEKRLTELFKMDWNQIRKMLMELMMTGACKTAETVRKVQVARKVRSVRKNVKSAAKKMTPKPSRKSSKKRR